MSEPEGQTVNHAKRNSWGLRILFWLDDHARPLADPLWTLRARRIAARLRHDEKGAT
jgi:hypothetical protein